MTTATPPFVKVFVSPKAYAHLVTLAVRAGYANPRPHNDPNPHARGVGPYLQALFALNAPLIHPPSASPHAITQVGGGFIDQRPWASTPADPDLLPTWVPTDDIEYRRMRTFQQGSLPTEAMYQLALRGGITISSHHARRHTFPFDNRNACSSAIMEVLGHGYLTPFHEPHNPRQLTRRYVKAPLDWKQAW